MTDNFDNYRKLIVANGGLPDTNERGNLDKYYVVELMRRGKDNPDLPAANYHFKNYYIYSWRDLDRYKDEIKNICDLLRLRAYCSVNYKLMSQVALDTVAESARRIAAHDYKKFYNIFESCSGKFSCRDNNLWVVDFVEWLSEDDIYDIHNFLNEMKSGYKDNLVFVMPTKSGVHLICHPFNLQQFNTEFPKRFGSRFTTTPDVKKNHLTLLYEDL